MSSLGTHLRELREARGASLDDIARSTRVGRRHLEALESDSLGELPAPVFVKGFIRAYCEFLDAAPGEALGMYREATGEAVKPERVQSVARMAPSGWAGPLLVSLVLFIALGASLFALRIGLKNPPPQAPAASGAAGGRTESVPSQPPTPVTAPPAIPAQPDPVPAAGPQPAGQRLMIRAVEPTWIRVQVDEGQVAEELLQAGAVREWTAARHFVLTVGNAGGIEVDLNGRRVPPLGARGAVIQRLVLPPDAPTGGS
jgi:cytoskeleton protein RodZ